jgi:hypothetical protein
MEMKDLQKRLDKLQEDYLAECKQRHLAEELQHSNPVVFVKPCPLCDSSCLATPGEITGDRTFILDEKIEDFGRLYKRLMDEFEAAKRMAYARGYVAGHQDGVDEANEAEDN